MRAPILRNALQVRLKDDDLTALLQAAARAQLPPSVYVRQRILAQVRRELSQAGDQDHDDAA